MRPLSQYKTWPYLVGKDINQSLLRRFSYGTEKRLCFIAGVQRSGTNMIMNVIERHPDTYVFKESDGRVFDGYMMRAINHVEKLVNRTIPNFVIIKALHEAHDLYWMLDHFDDSRVIWMYRHYFDVINSNQRRFSEPRNYIDQIVKDPRRGFWRGLGMTDKTLSIIRDHYTEDLDDSSALALFWYYRNQLFFDQNFDTDNRCLLVRYDSFVTDSAKYADFISDFIGLAPRKDLVRNVHSSSIRKNSSPKIRPDVKALCDRMLERLDSVFDSKVERALR